MLNYIEQINLLHKVRRKDSLEPITVALHVILLDICNTYDWENPFNLKNDKILSDLDVTFKTLAAARNKLQQSGLIKFTTRPGSSDCIYQILKPDECTSARTFVKIPKVRDEVRDEVTAEVRDEVNAEVAKRHYGININQTKPKQKKKIAEGKPPPGPDKIYSACMRIYYDWFEKKFTVAPKIDAVQGKALKEVIAYFTTVIKKRKPEEEIPEAELEESIKGNLQWILDSWDMLEPFYQKQTKLVQISSNIQNIIVQIKTKNEANGQADKKGGTPLWRRN